MKNNEELNEILESLGFTCDEFSYINSTEGLICHVEYSPSEIWKNNSFELILDDFNDLSLKIEKLLSKLNKKKISFKDFSFIFKNNKENKPSLFIRLIIL